MKSNAMNSIRDNGNMPLMDLPVDFIVYDDITSDLLKFYASFPCKLQTCIFAYIVNGNVTATVNLWNYRLKANDFVVIVPGTFIQIQELSDDLKISFVGFSSSFLKNVNFWKVMSPIMLPIFTKPIFHLSNEFGSLFSDAMSLLTRASQIKGNVITRQVAQSMMEILIEMLIQGMNNDLASSDKSMNTREQQILSEFLQLAFENYREEHKISFYAHEVNLTLSHFCSVINKATGMTPQEIIMNMIIMDAKTQLKASHTPIASIAASLGFPTATTFTRYFRTYTNMTPQEYRNSK
ncbi:MAG: helix-turn-helix domain-containing protein [Muribaculaceae bacterium]